MILRLIHEQLEAACIHVVFRQHRGEAPPWWFRPASRAEFRLRRWVRPARRRPSPGRVHEAIGWALWQLSRAGLAPKPRWSEDLAENSIVGYGRLHAHDWQYPVRPLENAW